MDAAAQPDPRSRALKTPKESPVAYAFYVMTGSNARVQAYVRPSGEGYMFETSDGQSEEGAQDRIEQRYASFDRERRKEGFARMQSFNAGGQLFLLP